MRCAGNCFRTALIYLPLAAAVLGGCGGNGDKGIDQAVMKRPGNVSLGVATSAGPTALICDCANQVYDQNQDITLSATCSNPDPNHSIIKNEWDFSYGGTTFNVQASGAVVTKVGGYPAYGSYPVALRVTDDAQQTDINVCTVIVKPPPHCPHPDAGGDITHTYHGSIGVPVSFDGRASFDPDFDPVTFVWSLNGNGVFGDATGPTATWTYTTPGTFTVGVQVTDHPDQNPNPSPGQACTRMAFATVVVADQPPTSNPGGPYQCAPGQTIALDGSGSSDPDPGDAITYGWDLDNDGLFTDSTAVKPLFTCGTIFGTVYSVCLRVTDKAGERSTRCTTVSVTNPPPTCIAGPAAVMECNGGAVAFQLDGSASSDPLGRPLTFTWSAGSCDAGSVTFSNASAATTAASFNAGALNSCVDRCSVTLTCDNGAVRSTSSTTLTVVDTTRPSISCPPPTTVECTGNKSAPANPGMATASDTCSATTVLNASPGSFPLGTTTTAFTATDACGNSSSCQSAVSVVDTTPPAITCPNPITAECTGNQSASVTPGVASASDVCSSASVTGPPTSSYPLGTTVVTYSATDESGNTSACQSSIRVQDTTAPNITCPPPLVAECTGNASAQITPGAATASDTCSPTTLTGPAAGSYPLGTTVIAYSAHDQSGNVSSCASNITVVDTTPPAFDPVSLADRIVVGSCNAAPVAFAPPSVSEACTHAVVDCESVPGNSFGANRVSCMATDASGNVSSATLTVHVLQPFHVTFLPPLADDNVADDVETDADVSNLFRPGQVIPHKVKLFDCQGADVTASAAVAVKLTVSRGAGGGGTDLINDMDDFAGIGDADGRMVLVGGAYQYNLKTNGLDYPRGGRVFQSLVTVSYTSAPQLVAGAEDARLVSR